MNYVNILTNKKTAAVCAWFIFELCSAAMCIISICKGWCMGVCLMAAVFACGATVVTFHPKVPIKAQATVLMLMSYINVFTCSIMEDSIYNSVAVFIEIAVVLSAYRYTKLLFWYIMLVLSGGNASHCCDDGHKSFQRCGDNEIRCQDIDDDNGAHRAFIFFIEGLNTYEKMLIQVCGTLKKRNTPRRISLRI